MKRKIVWVVVSSLMVLSLVMASCAPAAVEEEEEVVVEEVVEEEVEEEVVAPVVEKPKYGGMLRIAEIRAIQNFSPIGGKTSRSQTLKFTNEPLLIGDWAKGPAGGYGTLKTTWTESHQVWEYFTGGIAESWELPTKIEGETATITWHIRKGVHWALNPDSEASRLVGGRELTVDDVLMSLRRTYTVTWSQLYYTDVPLRDTKISSPEPWVITTENVWEHFELHLSRFAAGIPIHPEEVVEKYGNMQDWRVSVGTGAFMLTDYVAGSTATFVRNPNYWNKDPVGPGKGNQLPYLDGIKQFIILDVSTRLAALRTAKIDQLVSLESEDVLMFKKTTPDLMFTAAGVTGSNSAAFKLDVAPFNDIRVRRAMLMAIDFEGIKRDYYGGEAKIFNWPVTYSSTYADALLTLDDPEMPESVRELYSYNPEKAKALLAEAGYPDGFKTNLILPSTAEAIDYYSIIADMLSKVDVDLELHLQEEAAMTAKARDKDFDQMITLHGAPMSAQVYKMEAIYGPGFFNMGVIDDPVVNEAYPKIQMSMAIPGAEAYAEANRLYKEMLKHLLGQAYAIPRVGYYTYNAWWPWLKNYSGEGRVGYRAAPNFPNWVWLDQELKKSMGY